MGKKNAYKNAYYVTLSWSLVICMLSGDTGVSEGSHCECQPQVWPWYEIQSCSLRQCGMSDAPSWPDVGRHSPRHLSVCVCVCFWPEWAVEYCNHHLLPYESCCSPGGETVPRLFFPSALLWGFRTCLGSAGWSQERMKEMFSTISQLFIKRMIKKNKKRVGSVQKQAGGQD